MSVTLAAQLREGTKKAHTMAENTGFVSCFLKGVVDKASYRKLVADLYLVYAAMEEEIGQLKDHPVVGPVGMEQLNRREALEQLLLEEIPRRAALRSLGDSARNPIARMHDDGYELYNRRFGGPLAPCLIFVSTWYFGYTFHHSHSLPLAPRRAPHPTITRTFRRVAQYRQ